MKVIIVALAFVAIVAALPVDVKEPLKILRSDFDQQADGGYKFNFETENGIARDEVGEVKEAVDEENKPRIVIVVRGSYSYKNVDGKVESINYYADENGFHAEGDSIPKPVSRR
ncbi:larval cuticle protein 1-like [Danaus plexippus]|uniref:larval cuticle protein 1-like n=1 Tax=Danaus plexippus TaxID=13037 RepID=UPI000239FC0A|nr:larval cuticle protein 1-like [Danaus plexippus]